MGVFSNNPDYWRGRSSSRASSSFGSRNGDVEVSGFTETGEVLGRIMTNDPHMAKELRGFIKKALKEARKNLTKDARDYMNSDPRKAANAVKYGVYKSLFGGNLSILKKRKAGAKYQLIRKRKLDENPHQRGGNRRPRIDDDRNRLETYYSSDRNFILRFISSGTVERVSRFGKRGSIRQTAWFGHTAPWHMETAAEKVAEAINEYVKQQTNG